MREGSSPEKESLIRMYHCGPCKVDPDQIAGDVGGSSLVCKWASPLPHESPPNSFGDYELTLCVWSFWQPGFVLVFGTRMRRCPLAKTNKMYKIYWDVVLIFVHLIKAAVYGKCKQHLFIICFKSMDTQYQLPTNIFDLVISNRGTWGES